MSNSNHSTLSRFERERQQLLSKLEHLLLEFDLEQQYYRQQEVQAQQAKAESASQDAAKDSHQFSTISQLASLLQQLNWTQVFPEFANFCSPLYFASHGYNGISEFVSRAYRIPDWITAVEQERAKIFLEVQNKLLRELIYLQDWYRFEGKILEQNLLSLNYPSEIVLLRRLQLLLSFLPLKLQTEFQILQLEAYRENLLQTPIAQLEEIRMRLLTQAELETLLAKQISPILYLQLEQEILNQLQSGLLPDHYLLVAYKTDFKKLDQIKLQARNKFREQREAAELNAYIEQINEESWQLSNAAQSRLQGYANYLMQQLQSQQNQFNQHLLSSQAQFIKQWLGLDHKEASQFSQGLRLVLPLLEQAGLKLSLEQLQRVNLSKLTRLATKEAAAGDWVGGDISLLPVSGLPEDAQLPLTQLLVQQGYLLPQPTWQLPKLLQLSKPEFSETSPEPLDLGKSYDLTALVAEFNTLLTSEFGELVQEIANCYDAEEFCYPKHLISLPWARGEVREDLASPNPEFIGEDDKDFSLRLGFGHGLLENDPKPLAVDEYSKQEKEIKTRFYPVLYALEQQQQLQDSYQKVLFLELVSLQELLALDLPRLLANQDLKHSHWQFQWLALKALVELKTLVEQDKLAPPALTQAQVAKFIPSAQQAQENDFSAESLNPTGLKSKATNSQPSLAELAKPNPSRLSARIKEKSLTSLIGSRTNQPEADNSPALNELAVANPLSISELIANLAPELKHKFLHGLNWELLKQQLSQLERELILGSAANSEGIEDFAEEINLFESSEIEADRENYFSASSALLKDISLVASSNSQLRTSRTSVNLERERVKREQLNQQNLLALQKLMLVPEFRLYDFVSLVLENLDADIKSALAFYSSLNQLVKSEEASSLSQLEQQVADLEVEYLNSSLQQQGVADDEGQEADADLALDAYPENYAGIYRHNLTQAEIGYLDFSDREDFSEPDPDYSVDLAPGKLDPNLVRQNFRRIRSLPSLAIGDIDLGSIPIPDDETDPRVWLAKEPKVVSAVTKYDDSREADLDSTDFGETLDTGKADRKANLVKTVATAKTTKATSLSKNSRVKTADKSVETIESDIVAQQTTTSATSGTTAETKVTRKRKTKSKTATAVSAEARDLEQSDLITAPDPPLASPKQLTSQEATKTSRKASRKATSKTVAKDLDKVPRKATAKSSGKASSKTATSACQTIAKSSKSDTVYRTNELGVEQGLGLAYDIGENLTLSQRLLSLTELSETEFILLQQEITQQLAALTPEQQELYASLSRVEPLGSQYRNPEVLPTLNLSPLYYQGITNNKEKLFKLETLEALYKLDWLGILELKKELAMPKFQARKKYHLLKPLLQKSNVLVDDIRHADLKGLQPTSERVVLHCDLNNCYATIESKLNPSLRGRVFAVTGNPKERHGIILAKSEEAKRFKVATAETIAQAKKKCPHLLCVPPHYPIYKIHSQLVFKVYQEYSDYIETVSLDEAWIDITDTIQQRQQSALSIAHEIRERIQRELQLTVSIGVSFNKTLAKLGSDLKKPNAVTEISPYSFKPLLQQTPIEDLIGIGRKTIPKLKKLKINYIYDLCYFSLAEYLEIFGSHGVFIWLKGNGLNFERVRNYSEPQPEKSISHGHTAKQDLTTKEEVKALIYNLSHKIAYRLIKGQIFATGVGIQIKTKDFLSSGMQIKLEIPTYSALEIAQAAYGLFAQHFSLERAIRLITVRTFDLVPAQSAMQVNFLLDNEKHQRLLALEQAVYFLNKKYQQEKVRLAVEFTTNKI